MVRAVLGGTLRPLSIGLLIGLAGSLAGSKILTASLYGFSRFDPLTYVCVAMVLALAALTASYVPARRAMRVDPNVALRCE